MPPADSSGYPSLAYEVTLTNTSALTADVTGFVVTFYEAAGQTEIGSDEQTFNDVSITPGDSLSWVEVSPNSYTGQNGTGTLTEGNSDGNIPAGAMLCEFVQWYSGSS